jgi:hypothetical protein
MASRAVAAPARAVLMWSRTTPRVWRRSIWFSAVMDSRRDVSESTSRSTRLLGRGVPSLFLPSHRGLLGVRTVPDSLFETL